MLPSDLNRKYYKYSKAQIEVSWVVHLHRLARARDMAQRTRSCNQKREFYTELGSSLHTQQNAPAHCWKPFTLPWSPSRIRIRIPILMMFHKLFFAEVIFILLQPFYYWTTSYCISFSQCFSWLFVNLALCMPCSFCHFFSLAFARHFAPLHSAFRCRITFR